jgi:hypothetical protein
MFFSQHKPCPHGKKQITFKGVGTRQLVGKTIFKKQRQNEKIQQPV